MTKADSARRKARSICVLTLGMHRSGTSALSGVLSMLGCDLPTNTMEGSQANAKGFFESTEVRDLNEDLLASAGSSWDDFQEFGADWLNSPAAEEFADRAAALLKTEFRDSRLIVLKDPRICRLLPFWLKVLDGAGYDVKPVLIQRNPLEVARSINVKKGYSTPFSQMLWLRHVLDAEAGTRGMARVHTSFEKLMQGWELILGGAQKTLGLTWPRSLEAAEAEIERFLSSELRHHQEPPARVIQSPLLADWLRDTYEILTRWAENGEASDDHAALDRIRAEFNAGCAKFGRVVRGERELAESYRQEIADMRRQLREHEAQQRKADDKQNAQSDLLREMRDKLEQTQSALRQRSHEAEELSQALRAARDELEGQTARVADLSASLSDAQSQVQERFSELAGLTKLVMHRDKALAHITGERDTLLVKLKTEREERDRMRRERDAADALRERLEQDVGMLRASTSWRVTRPLRWVVSKTRG